MDHKELIERLEAAESGSRELDAEIAKEVGYTFMETWTLSEEYWIGPAPAPDKPVVLPRFTTSLDAALTLVPEGFWTRLIIATPPVAEVNPNNIESVDGKVIATTPALALCIAALKARESEK